MKRVEVMKKAIEIVEASDNSGKVEVAEGLKKILGGIEKNMESIKAYQKAKKSVTE